MKAIIAVNKPVGLTPNQVIEKIRTKFPHFSQQKIGFAGRLDPMARGLLLLLVGDANFEREKYLNLNKTYEFTTLLGISTDSYDLLGLLDNQTAKTPPNNYPEITKQFIAESVGKKLQSYPPFSTKPVEGKAMFKWAKEGKLNDIEIPTKEITIYELNQLNESTISVKDIKQYILKHIPQINGFFRQEETINLWQSFFQTTEKKEFITQTFQVKCTSGTYVRSLVHELGKKLGCEAVTIDINRTKVGDYKLEDAIELIS